METENAEQDILPAKPEPPEAKKASLWRTVISLLIYIAVDYWIFKSWLAVLLLVSVIIIHELGHFIAMKAFGYKGVSMTFVPFVGAYVSGETESFSKRNRIIVLLAGPLPGIIAGLVLFYLYQTGSPSIFYWAAVLFLLLNVFNLLPVTPLDGGQFFETMFLSGSKKIQLVFLYISLALILFVMIKWNQWGLALLAVLIYVRAEGLKSITRAQKAFDENNVNYKCTYGDLTDEEYWKIRDIVVANNKLLMRNYMPGVPSDKEGELVGFIKSCLLPPYETELSAGEKIFFMTLWFAGMAAPVFLWLYYKGGL